MSAATTSPLRVVLHEGAGSRPLDDDRRFELLRTLLEKGFPVTAVRGANGTEVAPSDGSDVLVLREPEESADVSREPSTGAAESAGVAVEVRFGDITGRSTEEVVALVESARAECGAYENPGWKPWFPVIDYDRCTNCMQCLSFCLFDVYGVDGEGEIEVRNEEKCKTNCPACSRVCPEVAILFPKYGAGPINGDVVQAADVDREKMKIDISALLGGDIYSMLRDRHERAASRFSKERDEGKALKERIRCLKKLGEDLDIPEEVLMALPSQSEIMAKARRKAEEGAPGRVTDGEDSSKD